jgi:hypothetical protein
VEDFKKRSNTVCTDGPAPTISPADEQMPVTGDRDACEMAPAAAWRAADAFATCSSSERLGSELEREPFTAESTASAAAGSAGNTDTTATVRARRDLTDRRHNRPLDLCDQLIPAISQIRLSRARSGLGVSREGAMGHRDRPIGWVAHH